MSAPRELAKTIGRGRLAGPDMIIDWAVGEVDPVTSRQPCHVKVYFKDGQGKTFSVAGMYEFDPIDLARIEQGGEAEWKKYLVEMATVLVEGARDDAREKRKQS